jgi:hypothetical protein
LLKRYLCFVFEIDKKFSLLCESVLNCNIDMYLYRAVAVSSNFILVDDFIASANVECPLSLYDALQLINIETTLMSFR